MIRRGLASVLAAGFLGGCSPVYVLKSAVGHADLLARREKISALLERPALSPELKGKLRLLVAAREFAFSRMGLKPTPDFSTVSMIQRPHVTWLVSGSARTKLAAHEWWFPFIGRVPYQGHFKEADANREARRLERRGWDAHVSGVSAYNTPMWFSDPLPSPTLAYPAGELASLVIHELAHGTLFFRGEVGFSEALATFVGEQGGRDFLESRFGPGSPELAEFDRGLASSSRFDAALGELTGRLEALYSGTLTEDEKLRERIALFDRGRQKLSKALGRDSGPVNNAFITAHQTYRKELGDFDQVYRWCRRDWPCAVRIFNELDPRRPRAALKALLSRLRATAKAGR